MKFSFALVTLVAGVSCAAVPAEVLGRDDGSVPDVEYIFSGPLEKGGPVVEYTGSSVEDIEAQVKKDFPGLSIHTAPIIDNGMSTVDDSPAVLAERELSKRYKPWSTCITKFGWGDGFEMNSLWRRLDGMTDNTFLVQPRRCVSLGCYGTAGAALCNDQHNIAQRFSGRFTAPHIRHLATVDCIWPGRTCGGRGKTPPHMYSTGIAGQRFFNDDKNNVLAGACGAFASSWNPHK